MRVLKIVVLVIIALSILVFGIGAFLSKDFRVERSIEIDAAPEIVFDEINSLKKWNAWSPWLARDPSILERGVVVGGDARRLSPELAEEIRADARQVVVGPRAALLARRVRVDGLNWLVSSPPDEGARLRVQLRYRAPAVDARLAGAFQGELSVELDEPHAAVSPGQSAVFFQGDLVLGGGRIVEAGAACP